MLPNNQQGFALAQQGIGDEQEYALAHPDDSAALENSINAMGNPGWSAFFAGMGNTEKAANDAGMNFRPKWGGFGEPSSPAIKGLRQSLINGNQG